MKSDHRKYQEVSMTTGGGGERQVETGGNVPLNIFNHRRRQFVVSSSLPVSLRWLARPFSLSLSLTPSSQSIIVGFCGSAVSS